MQGRDARDFLNRLSTVDVRNLSVGECLPGFFLNPQGKVRSAFRIAALAPDSFLIEVEGGKDSQWKASFLSFLDQFTFTEKYELTEKTGLKCAWIFGSEVKTTLIVLQGSPKTFGTEWTSVWGEPTAVDEFLRTQSIPTMSEAEFERMRILSLAPQIDVELQFDSNPLELGLRAGISDNKGCYPGQEVIEKIISLGSPAKRLAKLVGTGTAPKSGDKVFLADGEVGQVTSTTTTENGFAALALLRKNAAHEGQALTLRGDSRETPVTVERISLYE